MRIRKSTFLTAAVLLGVIYPAAICTGQLVQRIEARRDRQYTLTKQHGPWMIMVASFKETPEEFRTKEGLTPEEAANELVYELRKKGIPAYTYEQEDALGRINVLDRTGQHAQRDFVARHRMISVLAGNYRSIDAENSREGKVAQRTLAYVKKFRPQFLRDKESGARLRLLSAEKGPLHAAFLTVNPLLSPEEARERRFDPLLLKLNAGMDYSLLDNPGKYTLVVASFHGKSVTQVANSKFRQIAEKFKVSDTLDEAMYSAWELAQTLRHATTYGYQQDFEAYVFHDRYHSVVTVGSFSSPNDPRIARLQELFKAKVKTVPQTGQDALVAEALTIPRNPPPNQQPERSWIFDPAPRLIEVPRLE